MSSRPSSKVRPPLNWENPNHWKEIEGCPGYLISDQGAVWRKRAHVKATIRMPWHVNPRMEMKQQQTDTGSRLVRVRKPCGKQVLISVARTVLIAFAGPPPTVNHKAKHLDGDRSNNRVENLVWTARTGRSHQKKVVTDEKHTV